MSADRIHQELIRWTRRREWPESIASGWLAALEAAREAGALEMLAVQAYATHEEAATARARAAVCGWLFALANLIDDEQDGDSGYVPQGRMTPCLQALGWTVFVQQLRALALPAELEARVWALAERACVGQLMEVDAQPSWDAERYIEVTRRIAGDQWALYLSVIWHGTRWAGDAELMGQCLGSLTSVALDRAGQDERWAQLPEVDQARVIEWMEQLEEQTRQRVTYPGVRPMLRWLHERGA